jgi:hypothetical protein
MFAVTHLAYRALKNFTVVGKWDARTNFIPGAVMIAVAILGLVLCGRSFEAYGLSLKGWRLHLSLGLICSLLLIGVWGVGLIVTGIQLDSTKPPDPHASHQLHRLAELAAIGLPACLLVLAVIRSKARSPEALDDVEIAYSENEPKTDPSPRPSPLRRGEGEALLAQGVPEKLKVTRIVESIPPRVTVPSILALLSVLPLLAAHHHQPGRWLEVLSLMLGAGIGEEIFFRGYVQSRLDQAFGCPLGF